MPTSVTVIAILTGYLMAETCDQNHRYLTCQKSAKIKPMGRLRQLSSVPPLAMQACNFCLQSCKFTCSHYQCFEEIMIESIIMTTYKCSSTTKNIILELEI